MIDDKVELKLFLTPLEAKVILDALMSLRLHPSEPVIDAVNYTATPRTADIARSIAELGNDLPAATEPEVVPAAAPSTGNTTATACAHPIDSRGVPWHERHHSGTIDTPNSLPDGSWRSRRGHNREALKVYEAAYLGKSSTSTEKNADMAPPTIGTALPPAGTPGFSDFVTLWHRLVREGRATVELEQWLEDFGSHPTMPEADNIFARDPQARKEAYDAMLDFLQVDAA